MKKSLVEISKRLKNTGTIVSLVSAGIIIYTNLSGNTVDSDKVLYLVNTICSVGVALGVLNNPTTKGMDMPKIKNKSKK
ncbi:hypothetical protein C0L75_02890 [Clostridium perfringens]